MSCHPHLLTAVAGKRLSFLIRGVFSPHLSNGLMIHSNEIGFSTVP